MKEFFYAIIGLLGLTALIFFLSFQFATSSKDTGNANNVTVTDDKQVVELKAKGGYKPELSIGKAGMPTTLRVNTNGTFDCSSSIRIPSLGISQNLPNSGSTDIDLGMQKEGTLEGTCGMGMYPFRIKFMN